MEIYETPEGEICITHEDKCVVVPVDCTGYMIMLLEDIKRKKDSSLKDHLPPFLLSPMFQSGWRRNPRAAKKNIERPLNKVFARRAKFGV